MVKLCSFLRKFGGTFLHGVIVYLGFQSILNRNS